MVTIEQKLTLFSKLLHQDIKEETDRKFYELEKEYEKIRAESRLCTDKEANELIEQAKRKAESKKIELISKGKLCSKKETMLTKEKVVERFIAALEERIKTFILTPDYKSYLTKVISGLGSLKGYANPLVIYVTEHDLETNQEFIKEALMKIGISSNKLSFKQVGEEILGGLIIEDPALNMRIDESILAMLEENKDSIVEKITLAIGEVGGKDE